VGARSNGFEIGDEVSRRDYNKGRCEGKFVGPVVLCKFWRRLRRQVRGFQEIADRQQKALQWQRSEGGGCCS
jgi:hypothetical protein